MRKILNCCSNCAYANNKKEEKEFWCCFQEDFVLWCGTCPNHKLLIYCESCEEELTKEEYILNQDLCNKCIELNHKRERGNDYENRI